MTRQPAASSTSTAAIPIEGVRWLVKVSGHKTTSPRFPRLGAAAGIPGLQCLGGEQRHPAAPVDAARRGDGVAQQGCLAERVDQPGCPRGDLREGRQPAHRIVCARTQPPLVVMGQELGLHRGHVNLGGAVPLAALAGQAQVESVPDFGGPPAGGDRRVCVPLQHFEQQPAPASGGVLFFAGDHVGRAHHPAVAVPALAYAHAPHHGALEAAIVVGVFEERVVIPRGPGGSEPEVLVDPVRGDHLAGVHPVFRVEDRLELPESLDDLLAEHLGQQLTAGLPVAVLAGERSAVGHHQVGRAADEPPERCDAVGGDQVEGDPGVHAALSEMAVQGRAGVAELVVELLQVPQIVTEPVRRDRGILPPFPGVGHVRYPGGGAEGHLADVGELALLFRGVIELDGRLVLGAAQVADQGLRLGVGFVLGSLPRRSP